MSMGEKRPPFYMVAVGTNRHAKVAPLSDGAFRAMHIMWESAKGLAGLFDSEAQLKMHLGAYYVHVDELREAGLLDGLAVHDWQVHQVDYQTALRARMSSLGRASARKRKQETGTAIPANARNRTDGASFGKKPERTETERSTERSRSQTTEQSTEREPPNGVPNATELLDTGIRDTGDPATQDERGFSNPRSLNNPPTLLAVSPKKRGLKQAHAEAPDHGSVKTSRADRNASGDDDDGHQLAWLDVLKTATCQP